MLPDPMHPAIVHFPIVLAVLAPVVALGALLAIRRGAAPLRAWGVTTLVLAALVASVWVATATGEREEDRVERVVGEAPLHQHEEAAETFLFSSAAVLALSLVGLVRGGVGTVGRVLGTAGAVALVGVGAYVGHSGGQLVYRHGAASAYAAPAGARPGAPAGPAERQGDDDEARVERGGAGARYARK